MNILVLQHERVEHPGIFRRFLAEDGHSWHAVHLNENESFPSLDGYDALWVLGGPMDVWEESKYPWLEKEKVFIQEAVEGKGIAFLGLCLGHQLLAEALGGTVGPSDEPEIGVMEVQLTEDGASDVIFDGLPETFPTLQWHSAEVKQMPAGARCMATSPACTVQAMQWGPRAISMQFHLEVEPDTVDTWAQIPAYRDALQSALGKEGVQIMNNGCKKNQKQMNEMAERVYINWLQASAQV